MFIIAFPERLGKYGVLEFVRNKLEVVPNLEYKNKLQRSGNYEFLITRSRYVPKAVSNGCLTGITGYDWFKEYELGDNKDLEIVENLDLGKAKVVLFKDRERDIKRPFRVATVFPNIARDYMEKRGFNYEIIPMDGETEGWVKVGYANLGIDITENGDTIRDTELEIMDEILDTNAIIISKRKNIYLARKIWRLV